MHIMHRVPDTTMRVYTPGSIFVGRAFAHAVEALSFVALEAHLLPLSRCLTNAKIIKTIF
jgi:hypothetical protein